MKLNFKTLTIENSKKKGHIILPRFGICSLCLLFWSDNLGKTVFSVRNRLPEQNRMVVMLRLVLN